MVATWRVWAAILAHVGRGRRAAALSAVLLFAAAPILTAGHANARPAGLPSPSPRDAGLIADAVAAAPAQGLAADDRGDAADAVMAYARAQHAGRLPPAMFPRAWAIHPAPFDPRAAFAGAVADGSLGPWLAALPPPEERYRRLVRALARYRGLSGRGGWPRLATPGLALGDAGASVTALRDRLAIEDPAVAMSPAGRDPGGRTLYDVALAASVMRAQARYGLEPDGRAGAATIAALNVPVGERLTQIRANLERWRWAPRELPSFRIELNTADASLALFDANGASMAMRAIVGRADRATPMFEDKVRAVVFNPPWNVPQDIAAREIWPKIRRDAGYLSREGFVVRPGGRLQQRPGPRCALGAIKFELDNPFGVYLHDTPARGLFALNRRALSHGCMRLEDPTDLAKRLLAPDPSWTGEAVDLALLSGRTTRAALKTPVPVFVFYWTAFVDEQDQVQFRPDVYGWDKTLAALLTRAGYAL